MYLVYRLFINHTPLIPLSTLGEREEVLERGLCPLSYLHSPIPLKREWGQGDGFLNELIIFLARDNASATRSGAVPPMTFLAAIDDSTVIE